MDCTFERYKTLSVTQLVNIYFVVIDDLEL